MRILTRLKDAEDADNLDDAEVVCDGRTCYLGLDAVSKAKVFELLRLCLLRYDGSGGSEHYSMNEDGRAMANDPNHIPRIVSARATVHAGRASK